MRTIRIIAIVLCAVLLMPLASCSRTGGNNNTNGDVTADVTYAPADAAQTGTDGHGETGGTEDIMSITLTIGGKTFTAALDDTAAAHALYERLPMTLDMSELNGNEKYCYLDEPLPTNEASVTDMIHTGDIMLFGTSCIVVFYKDFPTSYSYTAIGHIDDVTGLTDALSNASITVVFKEDTTK